MWWSTVEVLAGLATGAILGSVFAIVVLVVEGGPLALLLLGAAVGGVLGGIAGVISAGLATIAASLMSGRGGLPPNRAALVGASATLAGSLAVVGYVSQGETDLEWYLFAAFAIAVATGVGWRMGPRADGRAADRRRS